MDGRGRTRTDGRTDGRTYAGPIDDYQNTIFLSLTAERNSLLPPLALPSAALQMHGHSNGLSDAPS